MISYHDFDKVEIHTGTILDAKDFPKAKKPAYQLTIDFGDIIGIKKSSAQITTNYAKIDLIGKQIVAVTNFPVKQIGNFFSEVLVLGAVDESGAIVLIEPTFKTGNGFRIA
jgi:tRNA-binding protein